jgi:hypothetical protein
MVVGEDVGIGDIENMVGRTLVGNFCGKVVPPTSMKSWMEKNWKPVIMQCPIFYILARVWICFIFNPPKEMLEILRIRWG